MGVGQDKVQFVRRGSEVFKEFVPIDASGLEISDFVLNQLRVVLGNQLTEPARPIVGTEECVAILR